MHNKKKRFVRLSWRLLECKMCYYASQLVHESWRDSLTVSDFEYDRLEMEYKGLAEELGLEPTSSNTVGFDVDRACCKLIFNKYNNPKKKGDSIVKT